MKVEFTDFINWKFWHHVTLEPSLALMYLSTVMVNLLYVNLFLQKSCRLNATSEPDLQTPCDDEAKGQAFLTQVNSWRYTVSMYLNIIFTIFGSAWSDKAGRRRRPLIYIPLVGQLLIAVIGCLYSFFWRWPVMSVVIIETIIHGATGARFSLLFTSQMYICDITNTENRTTRLGIIAALHVICVQIGSGTTGFILRRVGLFYSFLICILLTAFSILFGILFIKNTSIPVERKLTFWQTLNPTLVYESFKIIFKKRPFNRRAVIILLLIIDGCSLFPVIGESTILYLYLRYRFKWNEEDYSLYIFCKLMIISFGTMFSAVVLSKYFKLHDGLIGILSTSLSTVAVICYIFAYNTWQLYSISLLEFLRAVPMTITSSFLTKCLEKNETGHLMSIRCIISLITPVCFPIYNYVYKMKMDSFPSTVFIVSIVAYIPSIFLFGMAYYLSVRRNMMQIPRTSVIMLN